MKIGIRAKITAGMMIATLVPLVAFWGMNYSETKTRIVDDVKTKLSNSSARQTTHIDDWFDGTIKGMKLAAATPKLETLDVAVGKEVTQNFVKNYPWLVASFFANQDGQQIARNNDENLSNIGERDYFKTAMAGEISTQVAISKANNQPVLLSGAPVIDPATGRPVGVLGFSSELATVSKTVVSDKIGDTGFSFLVDQNGKLIAHPDKKKTEEAATGKGEDFKKHPAIYSRNEASGLLSYTINDKKVVAVVSKTKAGWTLVTQMDEAEAFAPLEALNVKAGITLVGAFVFSLVIALLIGGKLSAPIMTLTKVADDISKGSFDDSALDNIKSNDEIGELAESVKRLSSSVKLAMDMLSQSEE